MPYKGMKRSRMAKFVTRLTFVTSMGISMTKLVAYADRASLAVLAILLAALPLATFGFFAH
jgi:hypothetical protein